MKKVIYFFALLLGTFVALLSLRAADLAFTGPQLASLTIFSMFIYGTLLFGDFRLAFAFGGIALLMGCGLLTVEGFVQSASLNVIVFLVGMFLVIGFLEENQFFEGIVAKLVRAIGPRPRLLLPALMLMGTVAAALVDEVTSILFMSGTMLHLTKRYRLNPVPFIIMLVFATNIGSAASSIGNPIGVMIALKAGFSFTEFLRWSAPIAVVVNVVTYAICRWWYAEPIAAFEAAVAAEHDAAVARAAATAPPPLIASHLALAGVGAASGAPAAQHHGAAPAAHDFADPHAFTVDEDDPETRRTRVVSWVVFLTTILLLITHGLTERLLGLHEGTMMIAASLTMGSVVLLLRGPRARELVERRVDWWTLSFFMMLFASVGTLDHTGVTSAIAHRLMTGVGSDPFWMIQIVGWATGWLSAFLDNVLAVATFMPVVAKVREAAAPGDYPQAIYWLMLFGGTFMGNMTVIGSTANIIATGVLEKRGHGSIRFGEWFKIGFLVSIASMVVATVLLGAQTHWFTAPTMPPPPVAVGK